jgi:hypothetical protein
MLFAETHFYQKEQEIFKNKFPTLMEAINKIKTDYPHNYLSHLLLQIESHFVLNCAAREINQKYWRKAPLFTMHDCLISTVDYKNELEYTMRDNLAKKLGFAPKLKSKDW